MKKAMIRIRMSEHDAHYGGGLIDGARMVQLFGDVATELMIMSDGDEGLFRTENVEFLAPVYAGDYIEAVGWLTKRGNSARSLELEAWKVISPVKGAELPSSAEYLNPPVLVARASGVCIVPKDSQRGPQFPLEEIIAE